MLSDKRIGFIGAGSIGQALIQGLITAGKVKASNITVTNRSNNGRLKELKSRWNVSTTGDKVSLVKNNDVIVLAVKPKDINDVLEQIGGELNEKQAVITVAAGIETKTIETSSTKKIRVIRAMPNTSCLVKESATAICKGHWADDESLEIAREMFSSVGKVVLVPEEALDAVTGLSGSGPAYVYFMIEAMVDAGVKAGLTREVSSALAVQTVLGAAKMILETGQCPESLKEKVATPGGTTMAGLTVLEQMGFKTSLIKAVLSATKRSKELGLLH